MRTKHKSKEDQRKEALQREYEARMRFRSQKQVMFWNPLINEGGEAGLEKAQKEMAAFDAETLRLFGHY